MFGLQSAENANNLAPVSIEKDVMCATGPSVYRIDPGQARALFGQRNGNYCHLNERSLR